MNNTTSLESPFQRKLEGAEVSGLGPNLTNIRNISLTFSKSSYERLGTEKDRNYGFLKTSRSSIVLPPRTPSLTEKLGMESHSHLELDKNVSARNSLAEPVLTFEMRRKLFDRAEFTICKGRKINDAFHSRHGSTQDDLQNSFPRVDDRKSHTNPHDPTFKELEDFCEANDFKIIKGHH